jgi:predicted ATPase
MQTAIPVILVLEYFSQSKEKKSYTVEEPELSLFPTAQKALVEFFAEKVLGCGHELVITTHSPYILTSLNNLIFAHQVGQTASQVNEVISHGFWVNSQDVVSYFVKDGKTSFIIDDELQQIRADEIDGVSNIINATYDKILEIQVDGEDE